MIGWLPRQKLWWRNNVCGAPGYRWINRTATNNIICTGALGVSRSSEVRAVGYFSHIWPWEVPDQSEYLDLSPIKRSVVMLRCHEVMNVWRYEEWAGNLRMSRATGTVPERVQLRIHTTEPTGPVPEPFHCDHIVRWSARSGTTGRSGTGVNTGARLRSGTVPVPKLWCEHGLRNVPGNKYAA